MPSTSQTQHAPLFAPGQIRITPGIQQAIDLSRVPQIILAHTSGDSGAICWETRQRNKEAVSAGSGDVWSAYPVDPGKPCNGYGDNTIWVITNLDAQITTVLLPYEH